MKDQELLNKLKDELQELKTKLAVKENEKSKIEIELKEKHKITTPKQADKFLTSLDKEIEELEAEKNELKRTIEETLSKYES